MPTHLLFDSSAEIEAEPDNDTDDATFSAAAPAGDIAPSPAGSDPILTDHTPSVNDASMIGQILANDDGVSKSFVAVPTADGGTEIQTSDVNGNLTHDVIINPDESTDNETYATDGSHSSATVAIPAADPTQAANETDNFSTQGDETSLSVNNGDGTEAQLKVSINPDGGEVVDQAKDFKDGKELPPRTDLPAPTDSEIQNLVKDGASYVIEHIGKLLKDARNPFLQALGKKLDPLVTAFDTAADVGDMAKIVKDGFTKGFTVTNVSQLVAKAAEITISVGGGPVGAAAYHAAIWAGNTFAEMMIDANLEVQNTLITQPAIRQIDPHWFDTPVKHAPHTNFQLQSVPVSSLAPNIQAQLASIKQPNPFPTVTSDTPLTQSQTLVTWNGLDTAGFSDPSAPWSGVGVQDITKNQTSIATSVPFTGPVAGLQSEFVKITPDNINLTAQSPNMFIHSGSGNDAIDVSKFNGKNTIDGSTGSNFLVGGSGNDTFFVDDRGPTSDIWSTVKGFHSGDNATVWGLTPSDFNIAHLDNQGSPGNTGLTFSITAAGKPNVNLTLVGHTAAELNNGRLAVSFGRSADTPGLPGSNYMLIHAT